MENLSYRGPLKFYLRLPLYMLILFCAGNIAIYFYNYKLALMASGIVLLYAVAVITLYVLNKKRIAEEIIRFAVRYGTVQKELLNRFDLPYAMLDSAGRFMWMNKEFEKLTGKDKYYKKSINAVFKEITKEYLEKQTEEAFETEIEYEDYYYEVKIQKISFRGNAEEESDAMIDVAGNADDTLYAIMLFDVTEIRAMEQLNRDQRMVPAYVYIDNFEDTVESLEDVKKSLLGALIDRSVNEYFSNRDAVVRKIEKDKYFVIFQHKYLPAMEEDKFKLLEDVKTLKAGNEQNVTLSIGIGLGGNTYTQDSEFARAAVNIALGRGGSQAVIKNNQEVSYYGIRGKEVEKNTRVKARVKAQALREMISTRDNVIVMGHSISDADAFGAAVGVYCAAREVGKKAQIVLNTVTTSLRPLVDAFTQSLPEENRNVIVNSEGAIISLTSRTLVVVVDTNRASYTECPELLTRSHSIVVFDHHRQGTDLIENPLLSYIEPYASSACEMVAEVLQYFSDHVQLSPTEADCIYAGMLIDTNNFMAKTGVRTFEAAAYLRRSGADVTRVRKLLRENMEAYKARAEVVRNAEVYRNAFAVSVCEPGELESPTIVGAQAANELLNIVGIKASFVLTAYHKKIYISSRSIDEVDVQIIMERLGGGGHLNVAGAQLENSSISVAKQRLYDVIDQMIEEGEIKI
ncbi:MAG: DHH family phosphoesterase [Lachnospiraceae bacterium]|nr:DHH family phosphoesterase [Lachnospiraceae bacterium]